MSQLPLKFRSGEGSLGGGEEVYGYEPIEQRQFRAVHHSSACEGGAMATARALPLVSVTLPIVVCTATLGADHTISLTQSLQMVLASLLIGEMSLEFYQSHRFLIICLYAKIQRIFEKPKFLDNKITDIQVIKYLLTISL